MKAPKHKAASPKQAAARKEAGRAYAAAGRAAQASKRKANLAAGKPTRTKRQRQASVKWAAAGRAAQARKREKLPPLPKHPRALQGIVLPGQHPGGSGAAVPPKGKGGKGKKAPPPVHGIVLPGQHPGGSGAAKKPKKPGTRLVLPGHPIGGSGAAVSAKRHKAALKGAKTRAANKKKRGLASPLFGNDTAPVCTAAAIAAHLWLSTGVYIGDAETAELQRQCGGVIEDALELIGSRGLGGARLAAYWPLADGPVLAGAVTGLRWPQGRHSVVALSGDTCLSWGIQIPLCGVVEEQWWLEWEAEVEPA